MTYRIVMAPRPRWWHLLQASKNEVTLAVDLYNRSGKERQLEAFVVHVSIGWLKLLQARVERYGGDLYVRSPAATGSEPKTVTGFTDLSGHLLRNFLASRTRDL